MSERQSWTVVGLGCIPTGMFQETNIAGWKIHHFDGIHQGKKEIFMGELLVSGRICSYRICFGNGQMWGHILPLGLRLFSMMKKSSMMGTWNSKNNHVSSWWLNQPSWKIWSSKWKKSSPRLGVKIKHVWVATAKKPVFNGWVHGDFPTIFPFQTFGVFSSLLAFMLQLMCSIIIFTLPSPSSWCEYLILAGVELVC